MMGESSPPQAWVSGTVSGRPLMSWMKGTPVKPWLWIWARVSTRTGVSAATLMRATIWVGSSGARLMSSTEPTLMPLNRTGAPTPRPVTSSEKTTR